MNTRTDFRLDERLGSLAEEYHVASRNQGAFKHMLTAHLVHYSPKIEKLVAESPLHVPDKPRIRLPANREPATLPLDAAITQRVSSHRFGSSSLSAEKLGSLLYLGNSVREVYQQNHAIQYQRNVPNSGNLGSVEVYPIVLNVEGVLPGIYHYDSVWHDLALLRQGLVLTWLREHVFYQMEFSTPSVALVLTASVGRLAAKYGLRAYRLALLDVGHVSQNIYLASTALGLTVCATAGFIDDEIDAAVGADGLEDATMLIVLVGTSDFER